MRNAKAVFSILFGLLALGVLVGGAAAARVLDEWDLGEVGVAVGSAFVLALVAISLARRARFDYQRTLGRIGGAPAAGAGRFLGTAALLVSLTAGLAFAVFAVLTLVLE